MWSNRLPLYLYILFISSFTWLLEELIFNNRNAFGHLDSLSLTLFLVFSCYASFNLVGRWASIILIVIFFILGFTYINYEFYRYFGGFIGHEQVSMFSDLLTSIQNISLFYSTLLIILFSSIFYITWKVFSKYEKATQLLFFRERWRAPLLYLIVAIIVSGAHQYRYKHRNILSFQSEITYDHKMESSFMYLLRSFPVFQQYFDQKSYNKTASLQILAQALKKDSITKLPKRFHYSNFNDLLLTYPGYQHSLNELDPLLFTPITKTKYTINKESEKNILLIVMESVRAFETGLLDSNYNFSPNLNKIATQSTSAINFYSNNRTTVQAEESILCSTLDFASNSPYAVKQGAYNGDCIPKILTRKGYDTFWYHGNTIDFFNRRTFHPSLGFTNLYSKENFLSDGYNIKNDIGWGVPDQITFDKMLNDMILHTKNSNKPFFTELLTLTNHQPFLWDYKNIDFPEVLQKKSKVIYENYKKGIYYTDDALGKFWDKFNKSSLAENTIVIITADHGVPFYPKNIVKDTQKHEILYRVPLLIVTPERNFKQINTTLSHLDIAPTILSLLNIAEPVSFIGRPFAGKNATLVPRPIFQMNNTYYGFQYDGMQCLPYKELCDESTAQCKKISNSYCRTTNEKNFKLFGQSEHFMTYLELAIEAGFPKTN